MEINGWVYVLAALPPRKEVGQEGGSAPHLVSGTLHYKKSLSRYRKLNSVSYPVDISYSYKATQYVGCNVHYKQNVNAETEVVTCINQYLTSECSTYLNRLYIMVKFLWIFHNIMKYNL